MLLLTVGAFLVGKSLFSKTKFPLLNPLLTAAALIIVFLSCVGIGYEEYKEATGYIHFMLSPAVVALGLVLYEHIDHVKENLLPVTVACVVGSVISVLTVFVICHYFGMEHSLLSALLPKSVTTAIALGIADRMGGLLALTAIAVIITGLFGAVISPYLFRWFGIKSAKAQGLALGAASHVMGTSKAIEISTVHAAFAGLAVGVMGVATSIFIPLFEQVVLTHLYP